MNYLRPQRYSIDDLRQLTTLYNEQRSAIHRNLILNHKKLIEEIEFSNSLLAFWHAWLIKHLEKVQENMSLYRRSIIFFLQKENFNKINGESLYNLEDEVRRHYSILLHLLQFSYISFGTMIQW